VTLAPRVVLVHRRTELTERHGTRGQAAFYLRTRGRRIEDLEDRHEAVTSALTAVAAAIPPAVRPFPREARLPSRPEDPAQRPQHGNRPARVKRLAARALLEP
jgi:hypothetical protein